MKILFVKSDKIGSRTIRWGTGEPVSHVAVQFRNPSIIFHAYGESIERVFPNVFFDTYTAVDTIELPTNDMQEGLIEKFFEENTTYQHYDYPALMYFSWRTALKKFFNRPYPEKNAWNIDDWSLCTEIAYLVGDAYASVCGKMILPEGHDLSMTTPWQFRSQLKQNLARLNLPKEA